MKKRWTRAMSRVFMMSLLCLTGCAAPTASNPVEKEQAVPPATQEVIYLAGGCFWGMEKYMAAVPGVYDVVSGYANGTWDKERAVTYEEVCTGTTGFRETVRVSYDPKQVSLEELLFAFFYVIDPTVKNQQGHDIGSQYQTGIYYTNQAEKETVERVVAIEQAQYSPFCVEIAPLTVFHEAEEYHQDYLEKHPNGYCHITDDQMACMLQMFDDTDRAPVDEQKLRSQLTAEQYKVTQQNGTEAPFTNAYWDFFEKGIYVDVVSGEPLFTSSDKYQSSCGWPAFSKSLDINNMRFATDLSFGMTRTEVRSKTADSHLGHVFEGDAESPSGVRYCINSASLRFVPYDEMEAQGYGALMDQVE